MGLFLALTGIAGANADEVEKALAVYAAKMSGTLTPASPGSRPEDLLVILEASKQMVTVMYPADFMNWDEASAYLSQSLQRPAFSFHIHDGDLWMYTFFVNGEGADCFNPTPEYWGDISDEEMHQWTGHGETLCRHWPNLKGEQIEKYLIHWDLDDVGQQDRKAYPDDKFCIGQDWQLCDFMRKLGLTYPIDDNGHRLGKSYTFTTDVPQPSSVPVAVQKPWWKFW